MSSTRIYIVSKWGLKRKKKRTQKTKHKRKVGRNGRTNPSCAMNEFSSIVLSCRMPVCEKVKKKKTMRTLPSPKISPARPN